MTSDIRFIRVPILLYHRIVPDILDPSVECYNIVGTVISRNRFNKQMQYLKKLYKIIKLEDLVSFILQKGVIPENSCVITFDDNYRDNYIHAFPILKKLSIPATFFLEGEHFSEGSNLKYLDKYYFLLDHAQKDCFNLDIGGRINLNSYRLNSLSKIPLVKNNNEGLKELLLKSDKVNRKIILDELQASLRVNIDENSLIKDLYFSKDEIAEMFESEMEFGAHSMSHSILSNMEPNLIHEEIFKSGDIIKKITENHKIPFAYPFGIGFDSPLINSIIKEYGFYAACTMETGLNSSETDVFRLKRLFILENTFKNI